MIPPVLLYIDIRNERRRIPIPIPVILLWPLLLLALLAVGTRAHAVARLLIAARGLKINVASSDGDDIRILLI
jgi:hypothetical protein